jgi:ribosome-binding protein aMBF1 (putative translation factor)
MAVAIPRGTFPGVRLAQQAPDAQTWFEAREGPDRLQIHPLEYTPMANFSSVLKSEITRLARKEIKSSVDPLRKSATASRREIAALKRQVASLQRQLKIAARTPSGNEPPPGPSRNVRFSSKGLKALRARLGLSAAELARLIGASAQSIYNWEAGKAVPRSSQRDALAAMRGVGKREAAKRLQAMA